LVNSMKKPILFVLACMALCFSLYVKDFPDTDSGT